VVKRLADNPEGITLGLCYLELQDLGLQYKQRRDLFVDCLAEAFQLQLTSENEGLRYLSRVSQAQERFHRIFE